MSITFNSIFLLAGLWLLMVWSALFTFGHVFAFVADWFETKPHEAEARRVRQKELVKRAIIASVVFALAAALIFQSLDVPLHAHDDGIAPDNYARYDVTRRQRPLLCIEPQENVRR